MKAFHGHSLLRRVDGSLGLGWHDTLLNRDVALKTIAGENADEAMLTLANIVGIVMLLFIAKALSRDNKVKVETV